MNGLNQSFLYVEASEDLLQACMRDNNKTMLYDKSLQQITTDKVVFIPMWVIRNVLQESDEKGYAYLKKENTSQDLDTGLGIYDKLVFTLDSLKSMRRLSPISRIVVLNVSRDWRLSVVCTVN